MYYAGLELGGSNLIGIPWGRSVYMHKRIARKYLRALCRLYLLDFLCMGYALPEECRSLYDEVDTLISQMQSKKRFQSLNSAYLFGLC